MASQSSLSDHLSNPSNPLYLHPSESPSLVLVTPVLNGRNYHGWVRAMKMALLSKNKLCFVDGTYTVPAETDPLFKAWERCNIMVLSWLHRFIDESIAKSILWMERAFEVWKNLFERFSQSDVFRVADLQEDIQRLQQGERSVSDFYTHLKSLWDELENLQPLLNCTLWCIKQDKGRGRGTRLCTHCGRTNHTVDTCYAKHGYPPGFRNRPRPSSANATVSDLIVNTEEHKNDDKVLVSQQDYKNFLEFWQQTKMEQNVAPSTTNHHANFVQMAQPQNMTLNVNSDQFSGQVIGSAKLYNGLFVLNSTEEALMKSEVDFTRQSNSAFVDTSMLWHYRLGYISDTVMQNMCSKFPFVSCNKNGTVCDVCHLAKQRKLPYGSSTSNSSKVFELVHADIWGSFSVPYVNGDRYFLTIVDDFSRFTWVILMTNKGDTRNHLRNFFMLVKNQFNASVKVIRSDNGMDFLMPDFYDKMGIIHHRTCVESPQQNDVVERKHQHILNVAMSLLFQAKISLKYWSFCILHVVHLINRVTTTVLNNRTPYEALFGCPPSLIHLKVFGCFCFASTLSSH
ncbi:uncharacterized protein LOC133299505 [Gastrolobium bilobum]|uniref:uncharacterized protein LOC133299505 n=1 Tax=Gastrolobium bilobum TaxID=150636 RepID=UPI002AB16767|nr:uncharacterized protein LOC133299505 [Gastrolobium bilobum]